VEDVLRALADDSRRTVLETLASGPATVTELAALLPIARPGVSRHLRVLREAGLVDVDQQGRQRVYRLRPEPLAEVGDWLDRHLARWEQQLDALHTEVARGKRERRTERNDA
jgi:DNA-binding transcriptional ArsR family regulator